MSSRRGLKKEVFGLFLVVLILLISAGVFAETITDGAISDDVEKYIESFVIKGGIEKGKIKNVKEVDLNELPDEVKIKEINDNSIDIYELDYATDKEDKKLFVITYSTDEFEAKQLDAKSVSYFDFGYAGNSSVSEFLETSTGVVSGEDNGYVMMRAGSITGVSTSLELEGDGAILIQIYKNGEDTGFENKVSTDDNRFIDYDLQSEDIVMYEAGDVIAVYIKVIGDVTWSNVVTEVEITQE